MFHVIENEGIIMGEKINSNPLKVMVKTINVECFVLQKIFTSYNIRQINTDKLKF